MNQRDLTGALEVERATLSAVIGVLVRKGLIDRTPDPDDRRQKVLHMTAAGREIWDTVPDPIALITAVAFEGVDDADIATTLRVLSGATQRLATYKREAGNS